MHPSFPLFSHSSSEQPSSADVGTTCPRLFCMLPGSDPPPCKPLPFCGISCTAGSSTPSSVAAFVLGGEVLAKKRAAKALDELHTHICISALCRRGVSVLWEKGYAVYAHHCYDPQLSGLEGPLWCCSSLVLQLFGVAALSCCSSFILRSSLSSLSFLFLSFFSFSFSFFSSAGV